MEQQFLQKNSILVSVNQNQRYFFRPNQISDSSPSQFQFSNCKILQEEQKIHKNYIMNNSDESQIIYEPEYFLSFYGQQQDKLVSQVTDDKGSFNDNMPLSNYESQLLENFHMNSSESNQDDSLLYYQENRLSFDKINQTHYQKLTESQQKYNQQLNNNCNNDQQTFLNKKDEFQPKNMLVQTNQMNLIELQESKFHLQEFDIQQSVDISSQSINSSNLIYNNKSNQLFFENKLTNNQEEDFKNPNLQNNLKNIITAFMRHFKQMKESKDLIILSPKELQNFRKQLVRYMKNHSFNYSVVKYLTTHKIYKLLLLNFLQKESDQWLLSSKVANKDETQQKVLFLINCIRDPKHLSSLGAN